MFAVLLALTPITIFVSPSGRDSNSGTSRAPIQTFSRLQARLKEIPTGAQRPEIVVRLRGTFRIDQTIDLGPEASGVRFVGPATISGAKELTGWRPTQFNGRDVWATEVPAGWNFRQLFVGKSEVRAPRTRLPKTGFLELAGLASESDAKAGWDSGQDAARFKPGDLKANWRNLGDVELVAHHLWVTSRLPLASVDESSNLVKFTKRSVFKLTNDYNPGASAYVVENVAEALDTPGQWYLDRASSTLYYLPKPGERPEGFVALASQLPVLLKVRGAKNVTFANLRFAHSEYTLPDGKSGDIQAAFGVPGAVQFADCEAAALKRCQINGIGNYGVEILGASRNCRIERSRLTDLGAGGVKLGDGTLGTVVTDNVIEGGGRLFAAGEGVWAGLSGDNRIVHNRIRDFFYTGISMGWDWGFKDTPAKNNEIAFNDIRDIGQGQLSDMGGIYVLGQQPGSRIYNNRIDNVQARGYGGWGVYLDEGSTGWTVENNVVTNTKTGGFHIHYGGNNLIRNNIFAFAKREGQLIRQRDDQQGPIRFERNLVVVGPGDAPLVVNSWLKRAVSMTGMLYAAPATDLPFGDDGTGRFVSVKLTKVGLPPKNSEVFRLGFRPIDLSSVGPRR